MLLVIGMILMIVGAVMIPSHRYHSYTGGGTVVMAFIAIIVGLLLIFVWINREDERCSAKGGTYLVREGKCLDVKEVP